MLALRSGIAAVAISTGLLLAEATSAQDADDVAKQLANPIASLISVPLQFNYDQDYGVDDSGERLFVNVQPVIPFDLNDKLNLISRTILPIIDQDGIPAAGNSQTGLGDTVQSLFFSPKLATDSGWIWGAGPVFLLPTATDETLGAEKWGAGPTAVALKQTGRWTYGGLANHIESFAGASGRDDVSASFLQPFLTYITPTQTTIALNTESTYNWRSGEWSVPVNLLVNQLLKVGDQVLQLGAGVRYWAESPAGGPEGWGVRINVILVYPK